MKVIFSSEAWNTYTFWQKRDRKMVEKINLLIKEITRDPYSGKGKPELLKYDLSGWWSRRIDPEHRIVYKIHEDQLLIKSCRYHYGP